MQVVLDKITESRYVVANNIEVVNEVRDIMSKLSDSKDNVFVKEINTQLFNNLLCRYITSRIHNEITINPDDKKSTGFVTIDINVDGVVVVIKYGAMVLGNAVKFLDGVMYE